MSILTRSGKDTSDDAKPKGGGLRKEISFRRKPVEDAAPALAESPRANLLPPELLASQRAKSVVRNLRLAVVVVAVLVGAGIGGSVLYAQQQSQALSDAQTETASLNSALGKYSELTELQQNIAIEKAAVKVAGSTDIDWSDYIAKVDATLPAGVTVISITIDSQGIEAPYTQSTLPLQQSRVASITFMVATKSALNVPEWINALSGLPGFTDATPTSVGIDDKGVTTASVQMHVNSDAFSGKYASKEKTK